jgi:hypothetical protein
MEQVIECFAIHLESKFPNIYVLAIYRAPTGDFEQFLNMLFLLGLPDTTEQVSPPFNLKMNKGPSF